MLGVDALAVVAAVSDDFLTGYYLAVQDAVDEAVCGELTASKQPKTPKT